MRLIDAESLRQAVKTDYYEHYTQYHDTDQISLINMVEDDIEESPTIDPEPLPIVQELREQLKKVTAERDEWEKLIKWISVNDRLPENLQEVIVTFKNHCPEIYYLNIKNKPLTGVCVFYKRNWYWYSQVTTDLLAEYGKCDMEKVDKDIEVTHWMPLPEPPKEELQ